MSVCLRVLANGVIEEEHEELGGQEEFKGQFREFEPVSEDPKMAG